MKKENIQKIVSTLYDMYPNVTVSLNFTSPFELLICLILAAQCTDERVNKITGEFFHKYNRPEHFSEMNVEDIEQLIKSCNFFRNKAKHIKNASIKLLNDFNGIVPNNVEDLVSIPGIGRKSANCILSDAFKTPVGIAIDTHAKRICNRLGLSTQSDPSKIEQDILKIIDASMWQRYNLIFVTHGREICDARNPKCNECKLNIYCDYYTKTAKN